MIPLEVLSKYSVPFDHDGVSYFFIWEEDEDVAVFSIPPHEYSSYSGAHSVEVEFAPVLTGLYHYYIGRPVAFINVYWGVYKIHKYYHYNKLPKWFRQFLERLDGLGAEFSNYTLDFMRPIIKRLGFRAFAWCVSRGIDSILVLDTPKTEREAAEWLADWIDKKLPEYLAEQLID